MTLRTASCRSRSWRLAGEEGVGGGPASRGCPGTGRVGCGLPPRPLGGGLAWGLGDGRGLCGGRGLAEAAGFAAAADLAVPEALPLPVSRWPVSRRGLCGGDAAFAAAGFAAAGFAAAGLAAAGRGRGRGSRGWLRGRGPLGGRSRGVFRLAAGFRVVLAAARAAGLAIAAAAAGEATVADAAAGFAAVLRRTAGLPLAFGAAAALPRRRTWVVGLAAAAVFAAVVRRRRGLASRRRWRRRRVGRPVELTASAACVAADATPLAAPPIAPPTELTDRADGGSRSRCRERGDPRRDGGDLGRGLLRLLAPLARSPAAPSCPCAAASWRSRFDSVLRAAARLFSSLRSSLRRSLRQWCHDALGIDDDPGDGIDDHPRPAFARSGPVATLGHRSTSTHLGRGRSRRPSPGGRVCHVSAIPVVRSRIVNSDRTSRYRSRSTMLAMFDVDPAAGREIRDGRRHRFARSCRPADRRRLRSRSRRTSPST